MFVVVSKTVFLCEDLAVLELTLVARLALH